MQPHSHPLDQAPDYEALSYTWGYAQPQFEIELDDNRPLVGKNLYDSIQRFVKNCRS